MLNITCCCCTLPVTTKVAHYLVSTGIARLARRCTIGDFSGGRLNTDYCCESDRLSVCVMAVEILPCPGDPCTTTRKCLLGGGNGSRKPIGKITLVEAPLHDLAKGSEHTSPQTGGLTNKPTQFWTNGPTHRQTNLQTCLHACVCMHLNSTCTCTRMMIEHACTHTYTRPRCMCALVA